MNFYEFTIPAKLDGAQLKAHLKCDQVYIRSEKLVIGGDLTQEQATAGLVSYVYVAPVPDAARTAALAKLAALGLTTDDLKALGLGGKE